MNLTIVSYNVLASSYAFPYRYPHTSVHDLDWNQRAKTLITRIASFHPDIFCLQEVEPSAFKEFNDHFQTQGYRGIYAQKGFGRPDGLAIFFQTSKIQYEGGYTLFYLDDMKDPKLNLPLSSGHIALILYLRSEMTSFAVATTHIRRDLVPTDLASSMSYKQVEQLFTTINNSPVDRWVVCGDFNHDKTSELIESIEFQDAYELTPQPTYKKARYDYFFLSKNLSATPHPLPISKEPMPNQKEPSDHYPIAISLDLQGKPHPNN